MKTTTDALWALEPGALPRLEENRRALEARVADGDDRGDPFAPCYALEDGIAVVSVSGAMSKDGMAFGPYVLLESMRGIAASVRLAADTPGVRAVLLRVDSPGGTVDGITELAEAVAEAAAKKPLYAYADGLMASAAYWMSCGAREIAVSKVSRVGSIGVICVQREWSKALAEAGVTANVIRSGAYKAVGNPYEPLSEDARAYMQAASDEVYALFLDAVARGRGCDRGKAERMADGKLFMGEAAREAGLVDRVCTLDTFINHIKETHAMTLKELKETHAEALADYRAEVERELAEAHGRNMAAAITEERDRLSGLVKALFGEKPAESFAALAALNVSGDVVATMKTAFEEVEKTFSASVETFRETARSALEGMRNAHAAGVNTPYAASDYAPKADAPQDFEALVAEYVKEHGCSKSAAMSAVAESNPEAHRAWIAKVNQ